MVINWIKFNIGEAKVKGGSAGVHLTMAREGRPSGEAYVEMESEEDLKAALKKDREHMGNRYIEGKMIFISMILILYYVYLKFKLSLLFNLKKFHMLALSDR